MDFPDTGALALRISTWAIPLPRTSLGSQAGDFASPPFGGFAIFLLQE
jgi:hypothetical protein